MRSPRLIGLIGVLVAGLLNIAAAPAPILERVVIVMRHGVRPPTKSAAELAPRSDQAWPGDAAWGAAPGELTPHGAAAIRLEAASIGRFYADQGLSPAHGAWSAQTLIWADGGDQRTRETARAFAQGLDPAAPPAVGFAPAGQADPLFGGMKPSACPIDPAQAIAAVAAQGPLSTPLTQAGLARLQQIVAPTACAGGAGVCLSGPSSLAPGAREVKLAGPLAVGATLAENLLLEYENDLPAAQLGWGRLTPGDLAMVMPVHDLAADLTRATPYVAERRAGDLGRYVLAALDEAPQTAGPAVGADRRLVVLVGHDTNLSNLAGLMGLSWSLPGQPDATAPGVAVAFERWRDRTTGAALVRIRVFYQTPDQVRALDQAVESAAADSTLCSSSGPGACDLSTLTTAARARIPPGCGG